uniref:Coatomer subunit delta n=1 Tax=Hirondellea gigas TaxID=1518452 RepID=A0A6A7G7M8_9CRUS
MVVLSAAICTKNGKTVVSRQFVPMTRLRIEGLLSAFPKLVGSKSEHTFVETENVRYVYQPMEDLYLLVITNKQSNIMEDLDTLRLLAKLVPLYCRSQTVDAIAEHAFELVFAFDEVISIGYKEYVDLDAVRKYTEMDSHDEKLDKILRANKEDDARAYAIQKEQQLAREREQQPMRGAGGGSGNNFGFSSNSNASRSNNDGYGFGGDESYNDYSSSDRRKDRSSKKKPKKKKKSGAMKGMDMSSSKSNAYVDEPEEPVIRLGERRARKSRAGGGGHVAIEAGETIQVELEEQVSVQFDRDGGLKKMEVSGSVVVVVLDPDHSHIVLQTEGRAKGFKFGLHPKFDKQLWISEHKMGHKSSTIAFPIGAHNRYTVLRYKMGPPYDDESRTPLTVTFWPSEQNGMTVANVEYLNQLEEIELENVVISIRVPGISDPPEINNVDGETNYSSSDGILNWHISSIAPQESGTLEFQVEELETDDFYPLQISFDSKSTLGGVSVTGVYDVNTGQQYEFESSKAMIASKYTVE